jgi:mitogen-activated protein kinase 7
VDQLNQILGVCGTPDDTTLERIGSPRAQMYIKSLPHTPTVPFRNLYPNASQEALDILGRLLCFDPASRITVEEALASPYLSAYHDPNDEPGHQRPFDFSFEVIESIQDLKRMICEEIVMITLIQFKFKSSGSMDTS